MTPVILRARYDGDHGRSDRRAEEGPWNYARESPGLHASVLPWLKQRDIAILGGDGVADAQPSGVAKHNRRIHDIMAKLAVAGGRSVAHRRLPLFRR